MVCAVADRTEADGWKWVVVMLVVAEEDVCANEGNVELFVVDIEAI